MRSLIAFFSLTCLLGFSLCARADVPATTKRSKVRVIAIDPGYVRIGQQNVIILTGKHLSSGMKCSFVPVSIDSPAPETERACDGPSAEFITGTGQLKVTLSVPKDWKPGNLILTLKSSQTSAETYAITTILAVGADALPTPGPNATPASASQSSPFASCLNANATSSALLNPANGSVAPSVNCASSLLTEGEVKDNFGQHVGHTYFAIQVRVSNQNSNYDFLLRDIVLTLPDGRVISGRIRRFAQGVAVKGKSLDRRAVFYNSLQAGTGLYGALAVFASQGFKTAGNVLQGSFLSGFAQIFPDYTADNINRFNTAVFDDQNPSIVPKDSIGQPPLYVVALVPRDKDATIVSHYAERIAVSIEGTFIKQVSLVALSKTELDFGREFISPDQISSFLSSQDGNAGLAALRASGFEQSFTINNNNSTPLNISKIRIEASAPSSKVLTSSLGDFQVDEKTTCGPNAGKFNPADSFTIPAQSSCIVFVRFHPMGIGDSSATLNLEGTNLDGQRTVKLTGKSAALVLNVAGIQPGPHTPDKDGARVFACSLQAECLLDLGLVDDGKVEIPVIVVSADGKTPTLTVQPVPGVSLDCSTDTTEASVKTLGASNFCPVKMMLNKVPSDTVFKLINSDRASSVLDWTATFRIRYVKKGQAKIMVDQTVAPPSEREMAPAITGSVVNQDDSKPISATIGLLKWSCDSGLAISKDDKVRLESDGKFKIILNSSPAGVHKCKLDFPESSSFKAAASVTASPIIKGAAKLIPTLPASTVKPNGTLTVDLSVKTSAFGADCSGTVTFDPGEGNPAASKDTQIVKGKGKLSIPVLEAKGPMSGMLTFAGDNNGFCTNPPAPTSVSYTVKAK